MPDVGVPLVLGLFEIVCLVREMFVGMVVLSAFLFVGCRDRI